MANSGDTEDFANELGGVLAGQLGPSRTIDPRVENALGRVKSCPHIGLAPLARSVGLSLDRLSRLVAKDTGFGLRQHVLWNRVVGFLSSADQRQTLAAAAAAHGFADHAHLTRTCRRFIGRAPSEFKTSPEVLGTW